MLLRLTRGISCALGFAAAAFGAARGNATTVHLRLANDAVAERRIEGTLRATPRVADEACSKPVEATFAIPVGARETMAALSLCPGVEWDVVTEAVGRWAVASREDPSTIVLWPAGVIRGSFDTRIGKPPGEITIRIESDRIGSASDVCAVRGRAWECRAPVGGPLDVRIGPRGFASHYYRGVSVAPNAPLDLGTQQFVPGASIIGRIELRSQASHDATIELMAGEVQVATRRTDTNGFFQFNDVAAGAYSVLARTAAASARHDLRVTELVEHDLGVLRLQPPTVFELSIAPPADPDGLPWRVELLRRGERSHGAMILKPIASGEASASGHWSARALEDGEYTLSILDSAGSVQDRRDVTVAAGDALLHVEVRQVPLRGTVTMGGEPLESTLTFTGSGGAKVELQSDRDGGFRGSLPEEGEWSVAVWPVGSKQLVRRRSVLVRRADGAAYASVEIELPGGRIAGKVVDERGRGVPANLTILRDRRIDTSAGTEEDGTFSIVGLAPGNVVLLADAREGTSSLACVVDRDRKTTVRVVVQKSVEVEAALVHRSGRPVVGALVSYFAPTFPERREAVTGPSGKMAMTLPPSTARVTLVILAAGLPGKITTLPIQERGLASLRIVLDDARGMLKVRLAGVPPWPFVRGSGTEFVSLGSLFMPGHLREAIGPDGFFAMIEPGPYVLCPEAVVSEACLQTVVPPGGDAFVDASRFFRKKTASR